MAVKGDILHVEENLKMFLDFVWIFCDAIFAAYS
jgi:hypothetical protein